MTEAERLFTGGPAHTMDPDWPIAETELIDLAGRASLPGFQDAHGPPLTDGLQMLSCDRGNVHSLVDHRALISGFASARPEQALISQPDEERRRLVLRTPPCAPLVLPPGKTAPSARASVLPIRSITALRRAAATVRFRTAAVRIMIDGAGEIFTAALSRPYRDLPVRRAMAAGNGRRSGGPRRRSLDGQPDMSLFQS